MSLKADASLANNEQSGFTLIEAMIVVAIMAILVAIAIPSYRVYVKRSAEADVQKKMLSLSTELEQWRAKALTYKGFVPVKMRDKTITDPSLITYNKKGEINYPATNANYTIKLGELDDAGSFRVLTQGIGWVMLATPTSTGSFPNANSYLLKSDGSRCYVDHTKKLTVSSSCTGAETW